MAHAAPALQFRRANKRKYTVVTVEAKWATLELARKNRQDLQTVLAVRSDTPDLGCNEYGAAAWTLKEHEMYWVNCGFALSGNCVHHYCLFSDPGTHSYKECLVSLLWCWEINQGMHCPWQHLLPGKMLTPDEAHMDEREMAFAARQKLERVASYRQLQGYSNQLRVMSRYSRPRYSPGLRDPASWMMRRFDYNLNKWWSKLPFYRVKVEAAMEDPVTDIHNWVQQNRTCCR